MKRVLSLVLALALVLGSIPAGFAATATAGETLKGYGLLTGDQNGNLNEGTDITRGEMMVVLARLLGKFEEAKAYSIPSTSKDVNNHWAAHYIAFAEKESWTAGKGNGMFDPQGKVTTQETAAFMMKALGYTVTDFSKVVEEATAKGLLKDVTGAATAPILRGSLFVAALNTLNTPMKDSTVTLGVKLGVIPAPVVASVKITDAVAVAHNVVEVTLDAAATTIDAKLFSVVDKDAKAVEIKTATLIDSKTVWLGTADLTAGSLYTVKSGDAALKFTAIQKDLALPAVAAASKVVDNVTVKLVFTKVMDPRNALVAANYTIDNKLEVKSVAFGKDRTIVLLTTSAQTANQLYKVTVGANVTDYFGNKVNSDSNSLQFGGIKADTTAPKISSVTAPNAMKVVVDFTDASDLNKETAANIANYTIKNVTDAAKTVTVTEAKLVADAAGNYIKVELKTTAQVASNRYQISISNVADKFGNVIVANSTKDFFGGLADTTAPKLETVMAQSNTLVKVTFTEVSKLDVASVETASNYTFDNGLTVVKAVYDADAKVVYLTTSAQKGNQIYKLSTTNIKDEFGNARTSDSYTFAGLALNENAPEITSAYAAYDSTDAATYVYINIGVAKLDKATAEVPGNYYFGTTLGYAISAELQSTNDQVKVKINTPVQGTLYTVTVNGVKSVDGILVKDTKNTAQFAGVTAADTTAPQLVAAVALDAQTLRVSFSKAMDSTLAKNLSNYSLKKESTDGTTLTAIAFPVTNNIVLDANGKDLTVRFQSAFFENGKKYEITAGTNLKDKGLLNAVGTTNNTYLFAGNASAVTKPQVVTVYSLNKTTVDVRFNIPVAFLSTFSTANVINLTKNDSASTAVNRTVVAGTVLPLDDYTLRLTTSGDLTGGAQYKLNAQELVGLVFDEYSDEATTGAVTVANEVQNNVFYASSAANDKPSISSVSTQSASSIIVTMSEEVTNFNKALITINGTSTITATHVEYLDSAASRSVIVVYFNNTGLTAGSVKTVTFAANAVTDLTGLGNDSTKGDFAVASGTRIEAVIKDVVVVPSVTTTGTSYKKVRVIFDTAINNISASDFTITSGSVVLTSTSGIVKVVTQTGGTIDPAKFYSVVEIYLTDEAAGKDLEVKFTNIINNTSTDSVSKDGAAAKTSSMTVKVPAN